MIDLEKFKRKVIGRFCEQLTDQVFLMIQNDRELMNDYLHVLCQHKHVHDVNGKIAKAVKESFGLENLSKRNKKPRSFLIQSFEQFKTAKTLLTILMLCGVICGYAQETPPHAASTQTWTFGEQIWSDAIRIPACNKSSFTDSYTDPVCRTESGKTWYYYNWAYVDANKATLCPDPWRVPTQSDFSTLISNLGGDNQTARDNIIAAWGYGGVANGSSMYNVSSNAYYWSSTEDDSSSAYYLDYYSGALYVDYASKYVGQQVRCVK